MIITAFQLRRGIGAIAWVVVCLAAAGCAAHAPYRVRAASSVEAAMVQGMHEFHWRYWYKLGLAGVDGVPVGLSTFSDWAKAVAVDPGDRVLTARCLFSLHGSRTEEVTIDLPVVLEPGHRYRLRNEAQGQSVSFWVEDMGTRRPAGKAVTVSTTPTSTRAKATAAALGVLLRVLVLMGTGQ